ncbi:MAG: hypothetical protein KBF92_08080, partial [Bacteroidia bacterium]|nr:hypothetical protein [Bacteroidia bacterium]
YTPTQKNYAANYTKAIVFKLYPAHCDLRISNCRKSSRLPTLKGSHICRNDIDQTPTTPEGSHINDEIICQENKRKRNPKSIMSLKTNCWFVLGCSLQTTPQHKPADFTHKHKPADFTHKHKPADFTQHKHKPADYTQHKHKPANYTPTQKVQPQNFLPQIFLLSEKIP